MCIAITDFNNAGSTGLTRKEFDRCREANPDGIGLVWFDGGKLQVYKTLADVAEAWQKYKQARASGSAVLLHFRIATSGGVNLANCHPFKLKHGGQLIHNGMISITPRNGMNDTRTYICDVLDGLGSVKQWISNPAIIKLVEMSIGNSKLCVMDVDGVPYVINAGLGIDDRERGIWFSNDSYKRRAYYSSYAYASRAWWDAEVPSTPAKVPSKQGFKKVKDVVKDDEAEPVRDIEKLRFDEMTEDEWREYQDRYDPDRKK